jgi:hypothetical protein
MWQMNKKSSSSQLPKWRRTGQFHQENVRNRWNMKAVLPNGTSRIFKVTSGQLPVLFCRKQLEITWKIRRHPVRNTAYMFHGFPVASGEICLFPEPWIVDLVHSHSNQPIHKPTNSLIHPKQACLSSARVQATLVYAKIDRSIDCFSICSSSSNI